MINGLKKEMMMFTRSGSFAVVIVVMVALALMSPIMFAFTSSMMQTMKEALPEGQYSELAEEFSNFSASDIVLYNVEYVSGIGSIVILFLFKNAAGGEQKKRAVIIPQCAGLNAERYALPKFLIYPIFIFAVSIVSILVGTLAALALFKGSLDWSLIWICAVCTGIYLAFSTAVQLSIGLCTGRSNIAVIAVIAMHSVIPTVLSTFRVDRFNPFSLSSIALGAAYTSGESGSALMSSLDAAHISDEVTFLNVVVSIGTALVISVLLYFITIFVLHTREVHNEGNEPVL